MTTGSRGSNPDDNSKPANEVTTDFFPPAASPETDRKYTPSASEMYRELVTLELSRGRSAMGTIRTSARSDLPTKSIIVRQQIVKNSDDWRTTVCLLTQRE